MRDVQTGYALERKSDGIVMMTLSNKLVPDRDKAEKVMHQMLGQMNGAVSVGYDLGMEDGKRMIKRAMRLLIGAEEPTDEDKVNDNVGLL